MSAMTDPKLGVPIGWSDEFVTDAQKTTQWQAFLRKNAIDPMPLAGVVTDLREFLLPVLESASANAGHDLAWRAGNGWR